MSANAELSVESVAGMQGMGGEAQVAGPDQPPLGLEADGRDIPTRASGRWSEAGRSRAHAGAPSHAEHAFVLTALPAGVVAVYVLSLVLVELGVGDADAWMAFLAAFTLCAVAGICLHEGVFLKR